MNPLVEEAMRLADEAVVSAARETFMPGGYGEAKEALRAFLEQHLVVREPLTLEQIIAATDEISLQGGGVFVKVARAIEAAHGITKKGAS